MKQQIHTVALEQIEILKYNNIVNIFVLEERTILNMEKWREVFSWTHICSIQIIRFLHDSLITINTKETERTTNLLTEISPEQSFCCLRKMLGQKKNQINVFVLLTY